MSTSHPVAVIGSGPIGLAAAAHLLERGLEPLVLEAGDHVAAGVASWGHVRLFSPWRYTVDDAARRLLERGGWDAPDPEAFPTGAELRERYLLPLAALPPLARRIELRSRVVAVTRLGRDKMKDRGREEAPFEVVVDGPDGRRRLLASAVIDASGTVDTPNPLGASGLPAWGEAALGERIAYGMPDVLGDHRERYAGRRVLVVGSGHSAMNVLQDLVALREHAPETAISWAIRGGADGDLFGGGTADGLPARAALGRRVEELVDAGAVALHPGISVDAVEQNGAGVAVRHGDGALGPFDEVVAATGFRPDLELLRELRVALDPSVEAPVALAPLIDPNVHSCGSVPPHGALELAHPEPGLYIAGMKSYGRAPTFLLLTGYEQVRSIAAKLAGDEEAARDVRLVLPETGVCSVSREPAATAAGSACCG
jgi:thioredoxin reductase